MVTELYDRSTGFLSLEKVSGDLDTVAVRVLACDGATRVTFEVGEDAFSEWASGLIAFAASPVGARLALGDDASGLVCSGSVGQLPANLSVEVEGGRVGVRAVCGEAGLAREFESDASCLAAAGAALGRHSLGASHDEGVVIATRPGGGCGMLLGPSDSLGHVPVTLGTLVDGSCGPGSFRLPLDAELGALGRFGESLSGVAAAGAGRCSLYPGQWPAELRPLGRI